MRQKAIPMLLQRFRVAPDGALSLHGTPARLPSRPIHTSVDGSGQFLLIAYNDPSNITVNRLNPDGTIGAVVVQQQKPDAGIYAHQIRTTPTNRTAILVTRGNNPSGDHGEDPGALKVFAFEDGQLAETAVARAQQRIRIWPTPSRFSSEATIRLCVSGTPKPSVHVWSHRDGTLSADPLFMKNLACRSGQSASRSGRRHGACPPQWPLSLSGQSQCQCDRFSGSEGFCRRREQHGGVVHRSKNRRAHSDPDH